MSQRSTLEKKSLQVLSQEFSEVLQENNNLFNEKLFQIFFYQNNKKLVFPVEPFSMNRRYSLQQSVFLSTGTSNAPFMEQLLFLKDDLPKAVVKLEIPSWHQKQVLRELLKMNLHRASLFPDLDGYALSLKLRYNSLKSPEEKESEVRTKVQNNQYPFIP